MMRGALETLWRASSEGVTTFEVPSGQPVSLQDVFWEEGESLLLRVRFTAPQIARNGGTIDYETAAKDMLYLCEIFVKPQVEQSEDKPDQIIISLSDVAVPFGEADPDATQFFEAYSIQDDACIWEVY
jgi:hypothetical protein